MAIKLSNFRSKQPPDLQITFKLKVRNLHRSHIGSFLFILLFILLLIPPDSLKAKTLYPEYGNWFFNQKKNVHPKKPPAEPNKELVSLRKRELSDRIQYYAYNHMGGPAQLYMDFLRQDNISSTLKLPASITLPPLKEILVTEIKQKSRFSGWSFKFSYTYVPGNPQSKIKELQYYHLPFANTDSYFVSQGFNGRFSHYTDYSRYAVDIAMPEGTIIHSVSDGIVMSIAEDFDRGGATQKLLSQANVLRILHDDGSMAIYAHLLPDSVQVRIGQAVKVGQIIARSGNTGFSTGPHLHFAIEKNVGMQLKSIPFKFLVQGKWRTPETGLLLRH